MQEISGIDIAEDIDERKVAHGGDLPVYAHRRDGFDTGDGLNEGRADRGACDLVFDAHEGGLRLVGVGRGPSIEDESLISKISWRIHDASLFAAHTCIGSSRQPLGISDRCNSPS